MIPLRCWAGAVFLLSFCGCGKHDSSANRPGQPPPLAIFPPVTSAPIPALQITSGDGQLGSCDFGQERRCSFTILNRSPHSLQLSLGQKSCTCAAVQLDTTSLSAGQSATATLIWIPKVEAVESAAVRLWAELHNDRGLPPVRLEAVGQLTPTIEVAFPRGPLHFGKLEAADLKSGGSPANSLILEVFSRSHDFQIRSVRSTLSGVLISGEKEPMGNDRLLQLQARKGYRLNLRPDSSLPAGEFLGVLLVNCLLPSGGSSPSERTLELDFSGQLETSAVSLSRDRIDLPPRIDLGSGYRISAITLTIRDGSCAHCRVASVTPPILHASVDRVNNRTWRLNLALPKNLDSLREQLSESEWDHLRRFGYDSCLIMLELDHPQIKKLCIPVSGSLLE